MVKSRITREYTINFLITKYGKIKANSIRLLLFLSISLLGACTAITTNGMCATNTPIDNPPNLNSISTTQARHPCISAQGQQAFFWREVCNRVNDIFCTYPNYGSYIFSCLNTLLLPYFGQLLPYMEEKSIDTLLSLFLSFLGSGAGYVVQYSTHGASYTQEGFNLGNQEGAKSIDEQDNHYTDVDGNSFNRPDNSLKSIVSTVKNLVRPYLEPIFWARCTGSYIGGGTWRFDHNYYGIYRSYLLQSSH